MNKIFNCSVCKLPYDTQQRVPHVVPCGHSICNSCMKCLQPKKFVQCEDCGAGFNVASFPINHSLKMQLEDLPSNKQTSSDGKTSSCGASDWQCAECSLNVHPRHARVCVKCVEHNIVENTVEGIIIHNFDEAEARLICAHCVMESKHRFHITKLYLPAKIKQVAEQRYSELIDRVKKTVASREEISIVEEAMIVLRNRSSSFQTWKSFESDWTEAESMCTGILDMNSNIDSSLLEIESILKQIEQYQKKKQNLLDRLTAAVSKKSISSPSARRSRSVVPSKRFKRESVSSESDTDSITSSCSSLRRFPAIFDLSTIGADANN